MIVLRGGGLQRDDGRVVGVLVGGGNCRVGYGDII